MGRPTAAAAAAAASSSVRFRSPRGLFTATLLLALATLVLAVPAGADRPVLEANRKRRHRRNDTGDAMDDQGEVYEDPSENVEVQYQGHRPGSRLSREQQRNDEVEFESQRGDGYENERSDEEEDEEAEKPSDEMEAEAMRHRRVFRNSNAFMDTGADGSTYDPEYEEDADGYGTGVATGEVDDDGGSEGGANEEVDGSLQFGNSTGGPMDTGTGAEGETPGSIGDGNGNEVDPAEVDDNRVGITIKDGKIVKVNKGEPVDVTLRRAQQQKDNGYTEDPDADGEGGHGRKDGGKRRKHRRDEYGDEYGSELSDERSDSEFDEQVDTDKNHYVGEGYDAEALQHYYGRTRNLSNQVQNIVQDLSKNMKSTMSTAETAASSAKSYRDTLRNLSLGIKQWNQAATEFRSRTKARHTSATHTIQAELTR